MFSKTNCFIHVSPGSARSAIWFMYIDSGLTVRSR